VYREGLIQETLAELGEHGLVYEADGATWLRTTEFGDDKDRVLVKQDGTYTYLVPDIAYHREKARRGFDQAINVWGADHHGYVPAHAGGAGGPGPGRDFLSVEIVQMVRILRGGQEAKLSKRAGDFVTLRELFEETGTDVARYFFLMRRGDTQMLFDLDLALDHSEKNPVYKVQYAHARMMSIFRKAGVERRRSGPEPPLERLVTDDEQELIKQLARFPEVVERAAAGRAPHLVCDYLEETAGMANGWYHSGNPSRNPELAVLVGRSGAPGGPAGPGPGGPDRAAQRPAGAGPERPRPHGARGAGMSILVVGSVALDRIETPFGVADRTLGGAATHFSAAASLFHPVQLVGVIGDDFPVDELAFLEERGVDLAGLERATGESFFWAGRYDFDMNTRTTLETRLGVFAERSGPGSPRRSGIRVGLPGQHRPGAPAGRAGPGAVAALRGLRHHELLDRVEAGRAARALGPGGLRDPQRQRGPRALGGLQPQARRPLDPGAWAVHRGGEEGGARRAPVHRQPYILRARLPAGGGLRPHRCRRRVRRRVHGVARVHGQH
jgi:hypothetical protein